MNGVVQRRKTRHRAAIKSWFDGVSTDGGIERLDHLHIGSVDKAWKPKAAWIPAALESFELAVAVRDEGGHSDSLSILLAFDLDGDVRPQGVTFHDRPGLERELSYIPPSLYVLRRGEEFWRQWEELQGSEKDPAVLIERLNVSTLFGEIRGNLECVYMESKRTNDDAYSRALYLAG